MCDVSLKQHSRERDFVVDDDDDDADDKAMTDFYEFVFCVKSRGATVLHHALHDR